MLSRRIALAVFIAAVCGVLVACREEAPSAAAAPTVLVVPAASVAAADTVTYVGEVRARHEVDLGFRIGGKLVVRPVDIGAFVKAGTVLARLDPADLRLNVAAVRAQVAAAESDLALAKTEVDRYTALAAEKFVSQAVLDARRTAYQAASARLDQARAQSAVTDNQAGYAALTSDRDGVVTAVLAEPGQVVAAGQPVVRVARLEEKEILIYVPEGRLTELRAATSFTVVFPAQPGPAVRGTLRELAPTADPATRTYAARIRLAGDAAAWPLGMTARVSLTSASVADGTIVVPLSAVLDRGQGPEVWVVAENKAQRHAVRVTAFREQDAILAGGLAEGDAVVAVGAHKLRPGQAVRPIPLSGR